MVKRHGPDPMRAEVQSSRAFAHAVVFLLAVAAGVPEIAAAAKDKASTKPADSERAKKPEAKWQNLEARVSPSDEWSISGGWVSGQSLRTRKAVPKGLALPEGMGEDARFAVWRCPRTKTGRMLLAIARSGRGGSHDRLWVDTDFDGSLADEMAIESSAPGGRRWHVELGLPGKSGLALHKLGVYIWGGEPTNLWIRSELWREGTVEVGGAKRKCALADVSGNGCFNDISLNFSGSDRIRIEIGGELLTHVVGRYIDIDGVLYRLAVAPDGLKVSFTPARDVPMATVRLPKDMTELVVYGPNGTYFLDAAESPIRLPAGKYRVSSWNVLRADKAGTSWRLTGWARHDTLPLEAKAGKKPTLLDVGEPAVAFVSVTGKEGHYSLLGGIRGRRGEIVSVGRASERRPGLRGARQMLGRAPVSDAVRPTIRIRSSDGEYDQSFEVAGRWSGWGNSRRKPMAWQAPEGTAGPFAVTVEVDGPFKLKARKRLIRDAGGE